MLSGSLVALITPFDKNGEVDYVDLKKLVEYHIAQGTDAIVAVGTSGESATLTVDEQVKVVMKTLEFADGRIPVIAGAGANATHEAVTFSKLFNNTGVTALLSVTPYYNKPSQEGLFQHFKAIAEASTTPIILYNVPSRTGCDLKPETVARLAKLDNIMGIKDATGDLSRVKITRELCGPDFIQLSGDDATSFEFIKEGGQGVISVTANVAASANAKLMHLALAGKLEEAAKINDSLSALQETLFLEANPIPVKWAVHQLKMITEGSMRLPMTVLDEKYHAQVMQSLAQAGLL